MRRIVLLSFCALAGVALLSCQQMPTSPVANENKSPAASPEMVKKTGAPDAEAIANRLIMQVAGVKEGDVVFINGGVRDLELLEDLVTDTRKVGAFPLMTISSDRIAKNYYEKVPEKYDTQSPDLELKLATLPTVAISIDSQEAEGVLADVSPTRLANTAKTGQPIGELFQKRNVRQLEIGNDLYPTEWRARHFGISQEELAKTFWAAVNTDYSGVQATGESRESRCHAERDKTHAHRVVTNEFHPLRIVAHRIADAPDGCAQESVHQCCRDESPHRDDVVDL